MIIFHEGLPRSGKSYEAVVFHIIASIAKGRKVFAYVEGLDHEKIAPLAEVSLERCRELLVQITREQVREIYKFVENDSLVVIDELANFWPDVRQPLSPEMVIFIKEHGHRGLDILCMDQVANDCHKMWKGRIDTKFVFRKLDAIGKEESYKWVAMKRLENGKFQETTSGTRKYDSKYFGTYKSHTDGTANTGNYGDARANVKNSKAWKVAKISAAVGVFALAFIVWFFKSGGGMTDQPKIDKPAQQAQVPASVPVQSQPQQPQVKPQTTTTVTSYTLGSPEAIQDDYVDKLSQKYRIRLAGVLISKRIAGLFEWRDDSGRVLERLNADQVRALGWYVMFSSDGGLATLTKPGKSYIATQWPTQDDSAPSPERVPDATNQRIARGARGSGEVFEEQPQPGQFQIAGQYKPERYAYSK